MCMGSKVSGFSLKCACSHRISRSESKPDAVNVSHILAGEDEIATAELEELQDKSSKISNAIKDLEQKILDIGGTQLLTSKHLQT